MVPPEKNPNSRSCDISVESWWVKSLQVLHMHNSWRSTQPKEGNWSTHTGDELPPQSRLINFMCCEWLNFIRQTWDSARMDSEGGRGLTTPQNCSKYSRDNRCAWKGWNRKDKSKKTSDPHVLKQCAQRPRKVHLNCLAPAASKCASKLRERLYFLWVFIFLLPF